MAYVKVVGGLDPSLSNFGMSRGVAVFEDDGKLISFEVDEIELISTKADGSTTYKNMCDLKRAQTLGKAMIEFFDGVEEIYTELPVGSQSSRAMASYGICIGVVAALGDRVRRVSAKEVKVAATGDPVASKGEMIQWATTKYPYLPWLARKVRGAKTFTNANEHVADSLAAIHAALKI